MYSSAAGGRKKNKKVGHHQQPHQNSFSCRKAESRALQREASDPQPNTLMAGPWGPWPTRPQAFSSTEGTLWLILHSLPTAGIRAKASCLLRPFLVPDCQWTSALVLNVTVKVKESPNPSSFASISDNRFRLSSFGVTMDHSESRETHSDL